MSSLLRTLENFLDLLIAIIRPRRARKRRRVRMPYLMLLLLAISAVPYIEILLTPLQS